LNDLIKDNGILRGRELAELNTRASQAVKAARSPMEKLLILNAYIRQQMGHIGRTMKAQAEHNSNRSGSNQAGYYKDPAQGPLPLVEHIRTIAEGKKEVAFNSAQTRDFLAGREGKSPSRKGRNKGTQKSREALPGASDVAIRLAMAGRQSG